MKNKFGVIERIPDYLPLNAVNHVKNQKLAELGEIIISELLKNPNGSFVKVEEFEEPAIIGMDSTVKGTIYKILAEISPVEVKQIEFYDNCFGNDKKNDYIKEITENVMKLLLMPFKLLNF